jgi:iron complex outermembrane receptor protein
MLVLVDGRSVYFDFMGVTLWPTIPVSIEDIERIEVIRGPGSALYGADAFTGVVNIITRTPGEDRTTISLGAGNGQYLRGAFFTSGRQGAVAYRASASYERQATYGLPVAANDRIYQLTAPDREIGFLAPRVNLDARIRLARDITLRAGFGLTSSMSWFQTVGPLRRYWGQIFFAQPWIQLDAGGFTGRVFYNRFHADAGPLLLETGRNFPRANVEQDVIDGDFQYSLRHRIGAFQNTLQVGLGGRFKHVSWNYLTNEDQAIYHASVYLQDTFRSDHFIAVASVRGDYDTALPLPIFSPRGALIYRPTPRRALRLSGGTAFRTPTLLELYLDYPNTTPIPGLTVGATGGQVAAQNCTAQMLPTEQCDARRLRPESAISVDLGYLDQTFDWLSLEANLFWTQARDLIQLSEITLDTPPGMATPMGLTGDNTRINVGSGGFVNDPAPTYVYGAEIGARVSPIEGLDLFANYTLTLTAHDPAALLSGGGTLPPDQRTPIHKFNVGIQIRTRAGFDFEAFGHYASSQTWLEEGFDTDRGIRYYAFTIPDYFVLNARVGYRMLGDRLELGVVGTNLTDTRADVGHQEHPLGERLSLRIFGTASYRF